MATLGLSMIAKNEEHTLRACLRSACDVVSQIVIADTGSTDGTVAIAREFGATVLPVYWENHFAKARNAALAFMTTDWVLMLDADEELDAAAKSVLPAIMAEPEIDAYVVKVRDYMPEKTSYFLEQVGKPVSCPPGRAKSAASYHDQQNIRLFRRNPKLYFFGRVHELIEYRICTLGLKFVPADILIHHFGHLRGLEVRGSKALYYRDLGRLKVKEEADNPFAWFELGLLEYQAFKNRDVALSHFEQCVKLHPPFIRAWLFMAMIHIDLGRPFDALLAIEHTEDTEEAAGFRERLKGDAYYNLGQMPQAGSAYRNALRFEESSLVVQSRLGLTEVRLGDFAAGFARLRRAVEEAPHEAEFHDRLVKALIVAKDLSGAAEAAERFTGCLCHPRTFLRAASIRAQLKQWDRSEKLLAHALELFPDSPGLRDAWAEVEQHRIGSRETPANPNQAAG
jgi:glycosyltransferase involved in cell wall biosynthesis